MTSRETILAGGNRGAAVKPGNPSESLLLRAVEQSGDLKMPPGRKLPPEQIEVIRKWIAEGALWAKDAAAGTSKPKGADWWAFQPVRHPEPPAVSRTDWVRNPIDQFILARLEKEKLTPSPEASRATLLRRVSLDLTGLPPSPEEIRDFLADSRPDAYERVVDRLLASPHYGERWGRHWLDVARYADSDGYTIDAPRTMWRYRDWVINAINSDMPFDRFVIEQIAGDMLPNPTTDQLVATGFNRNTPSNFEGGIDFEQYRVEAVVDRVSTTGAAFLGLTVGCARCHDHKFDPISQKEFYQLVAYFNNTDEITSEAERYDFNRPILPVPTPEEIARKKAFDAQWSALSKELMTYVRELAARPRKPGDPDPSKDPELIERVQNLRELRRREPKLTTALVMRELAATARGLHSSGRRFHAQGRRGEAGDSRRTAAVAGGGEYAARFREVAGGRTESADRARHGESHLAGVFRQRSSRDGKRFRHAGREAFASRIARLAGERIHAGEVEPEGHPPADCDVGCLPAVVEAASLKSTRSIRTTNCWRGRTVCGSTPKSFATRPFPRAVC